MINRTDEEIIARIEIRKSDDILANEYPYYIMCLPFNLAKQYLKEDSTAEGWVQLDDEKVLAEAKSYMPFAFEKAHSQRGLSAGRSISHYVAWMWLLGHNDFDDIENYSDYGIPQLKRVCEALGLNPADYS